MNVFFKSAARSCFPGQRSRPRPILRHTTAFRTLFAKSRQFPRVPTDQIYPCHMLDDVPNLRQLIVAFSFKFNDVLDPAVLHDSLLRLLEIGEWKKLGGRVRLNTKGRIEFHVPQKFTKSRPAVAFSCEKIDSDIANHPIASRYPECEGKSRTFEDEPGLISFSRSSTAPKNLADFLSSDCPLISLHITSFNDATTVGLLWPHFLMDFIGQDELLRAWSLVLAGKEDQVAPSLGVTNDVVSEAAVSKAPIGDEWKLRKKVVSGTGKLVSIFRLVWAQLLGPKLTARPYVLTKHAVEKLVARARTQVNGQQISQGDVLTAWVSKIANNAEGNKQDYNIVQVMNLRFYLPSIKKSGAYMTNLLITAFTHWTRTYLRTASIGEIALQHRKTLLEQGAEDQILGYLQHTRRREMPLCIRPRSDMFTFTNWSKTKFFKTPDFSPAITSPGDMSWLRHNPPGSMVMYDLRRQEEKLWIKGSTIIAGKDHCGNTWMWSIMTDEIWRALDEELRKLD